MHLLEVAYKRHEAIRKLYIWLFWVFLVAAIVCFVLTIGFDFDYQTHGWISWTIAIICEARQQGAKGWLAGVDTMAAAIRGGSLPFEEEEDPSQAIQSNGATEEMNWRAFA